MFNNSFFIQKNIVNEKEEGREYSKKSNDNAID